MLRKLSLLSPLALLVACGTGGAGDAEMPAAARPCAVCHTFDEGGAAKMGPNLFAIVGDRAGSRPRFAYSAALKASGLVWTEENLDRFIAAPQKLVSGTRMSVAGEPDPARRRVIIRYLESLCRK